MLLDKKKYVLQKKKENDDDSKKENECFTKVNCDMKIYNSKMAGRSGKTEIR